MFHGAARKRRVDVAQPTRDDVALILANYLGSEGDHNTRETVEKIVMMLDELGGWMNPNSTE